ncbi:DUF938 domain-containing protein [Erythrobacter sp. W53]|uniref:DUF938 domain-containing protein n=1 Tax=Erythrobacteraceae TaxID=335929 RepID=UPI0036D26EAC
MKRHAPATARNSEAVADVLERELPAQGRLLEVASGSGEHAVFFARRFPQLEWQPSDLDPEALASVDAYAAEAGLANILPAIRLDASEAEWSIESADAILCVNMVHISPWEATQGLFSGAGNVLATGAPLILYGPYVEDGVETAPSNIAFDQSLKSRDPRWGLRALEDIDALAARSGFARSARYTMPANNLTLVYRQV